MTDGLLRAVIESLRIHLPSESCGFIVANRDDPTLGVRMVWMRNVHEHPLTHYAMDDDAVRVAYGEFDQNGEEPIAVYHSHPTTDAVLSADDLRLARDDSLAYVVVSFQYAKPRIRAYRVERFVGTALATDVPIDVVKPTLIPDAPWALLAGNRVVITYQRSGKSSTSMLEAEVTGCNSTMVWISPTRPNAPKMLPLERIRAVCVTVEGRHAHDVRVELRRRVRTLLDAGDVAAMPALAGLLRDTFPASIPVTMDVIR